MTDNPNCGNPQAEVDLAEVTARVQKVHVHGLKRTKNDLVAAVVRDIFKAATFEDLISRSQETKKKLELFGIFNSVNVFVDTSKDACEKDMYEVNYNVNERKNLIGGVSTMMGTNSAHINFSLLLPNVFGRAEKIKAEFLYGTKNANSMSLSFLKPLKSDPRKVWTTALLQNYMESPWSGFTEIDRGITSEFSYASKVFKQTVRWDILWREITPLTRNAPMSVRVNAGHTLKSAISHNLMFDTRDSFVLPSCGYFFSTSQEIAGLGGDVKYGKLDVSGQFNKTIPALKGAVLQLSGGAGLVRTLSGGYSLSIADRLLLGGPLTLRGFHINGCGPHEDGFALGADTYWLAAAHLYFPLPFAIGKTEFGKLFRIHGFVNAGNLTNVDLQQPVKANIDALSNNMRLSFGAGLAMRLGELARMEFNYCIPRQADKLDRLADGFQFGIGLNFM